MYLLGYDIGSSSVKVSLINAESGVSVASSFAPQQEMPIQAVRSGWAEQDPDMWWKYAKEVTREVMASSGVNAREIKAIGISYQMHGLVLVGKDGKVLRPAIIWCDSRAVSYGEQAFSSIGETRCLAHLQNSPGNFTASKLAWVKENEPEVFAKIRWMMLPGDYMAFKMTGEATTTVSGLSEGVFWDFKSHALFTPLMDYYGFSKEMIPSIVPTFSIQGELSAQGAEELGLVPGIKIAYRAGDQPNNALSLNVLNPGEIAATAGTSGVVYGVNDKIQYDPQSRVNTFAHVNHNQQSTRLGVLLCINGTGILNSWSRKMMGADLSYPQMNELAASVPVGCDGLTVLPFGNGSERVLKNLNLGASFSGINFNIHGKAHIFRAVQEGIVFSFKYGIDIMQQIGINPSVIRAGKANMFLSSVFRQAMASATGSVIELFDTDGSVGAARGAGIGAGIYSGPDEAFSTLKKLETIEPDPSQAEAYMAAYTNWRDLLRKMVVMNEGK